MKSESAQKFMLSDWFDTPRGRYVLAWEQAQFNAAVEDVFGFNAVQLGLPELDFLRESRIPLKVRAGLESGCGLRAEPVQLPLASQSIDLLALPHVLEFSPQPHAILREAERVLMPEGSVVMRLVVPTWRDKRAASKALAPVTQKENGLVHKHEQR